MPVIILHPVCNLHLMLLTFNLRKRVKFAVIPHIIGDLFLKCVMRNFRTCSPSFWNRHLVATVVTLTLSFRGYETHTCPCDVPLVCSYVALFHHDFQYKNWLNSAPLIALSAVKITREEWRLFTFVPLNPMIDIRSVRIDYDHFLSIQKLMRSLKFMVSIISLPLFLVYS